MSQTALNKNNTNFQNIEDVENNFNLDATNIVTLTSQINGLKLYTNGKYKCTKEFYLKMVKHYEAHECLWNMNSRDFLNMPAKQAAWEKIAHDMGPNVTTHLAKRCIYTLRSKMNLEQRKQSATPEDSYYTNLFKFLNKSNYYKTLSRAIQKRSLPNFNAHKYIIKRKSIECIGYRDTLKRKCHFSGKASKYLNIEQKDSIIKRNGFLKRNNDKKRLVNAVPKAKMAIDYEQKVLNYLKSIKK